MGDRSRTEENAEPIMQVYLVSESDGYGKAIQALLLERSIDAVTFHPPEIGGINNGIVVFLSVGSDPTTIAMIGRTTSLGNTVIAVAKNVPVFPEIPGVYLLPADIRDDILAGLISCFLASRDREAHYSWITDELAKTNYSLLEETKRLKATRDELDRKNRTMTEELALAGIIQNSLLPRRFPDHVPLSFSHKYMPHEYIGGDFYEILPIDDHHLGILIADVSGHGVSSALITTMLKSVFLHAARGCLSPARVLKKINVEFTQTMRTEHYITAFYSIIDTDRLSMKFANAGHPRQILVGAGGGTEFIGANGFFLGMFEPTEYEERSRDLEPGDRLINYTDGIIECPDHTGVHFGQENMRRVVAEHAGDDIEIMSKGILVDLISYMSDSRFPDDITLLITEVVPLL